MIPVSSEDVRAFVEATNPGGSLKLKAHPAADKFPMMSGDELTELRTDMAERKERGEKPQTDPIVLMGPLDPANPPLVLDGRNRLMACNLGGIEPEFEIYEGDDPIGYVISKNIKRRNLNTSQRSMIAAELIPMWKADAEERKRRGGEAGRAAQAASRAEDAEDEAFELDGEEEPSTDDAAPTDAKPELRARDQAAAALGVSGRSVASATTVLEQGAPELAAAVKAGAIPVSTAEKLVQLPKDEQAKVALSPEAAKAAKEAAKQVRREEEAARNRQRQEQIAAQSANNAPLLGQAGKLYGVVYLDPPWQYDAPISDSRKVENHYPTMTADKIAALPVKSLLTDNAIVFMWVTAPMALPFDPATGKGGEAEKCVREWGLRVANKTIWVKGSEEAVMERGEGSRAGTGKWQRVDHEELWWCVRGTPPVPLPEMKPSSVVYRPRSEHSEKPDVFAERIERMYPLLPKLEMFARGPRRGWDVWGNESAGKIRVGGEAEEAA